MNYTQLLQAVQDWTENTESSFITHIPDFVQQAEKRIYNSVQTIAARKNSTGTMTSGFQYVTVPSDWLATFSFAYQDVSNNWHYLINKEPDFINEAYPLNTALGPPQHYAVFDPSTFIVGPTPDLAYNIELNYFGYPTSIVTASTTWLGSNFDYTLLYGTLVFAYTYMKGEPELIAQYEKLYQDALMELKILVDGKNRRDAYRGGQTRIRVP